MRSDGKRFAELLERHFQNCVEDVPTDDVFGMDRWAMFHATLSD